MCWSSPIYLSMENMKATLFLGLWRYWFVVFFVCFLFQPVRDYWKSLFTTHLFFCWIPLKFLLMCKYLVIWKGRRQKEIESLQRKFEENSWFKSRMKFDRYHWIIHLQSVSTDAPFSFAWTVRFVHQWKIVMKSGMLICWVYPVVYNVC